ncbi:hypothetical protein LTS02_012052 [Friedmanniomyces endolithicus]|nr:hypothetical protein LTS02_012052 [Friedmanniomyces endolithicus]
MLRTENTGLQIDIAEKDVHLRENKVIYTAFELRIRKSKGSLEHTLASRPSVIVFHVRAVHLHSLSSPFQLTFIRQLLEIKRTPDVRGRGTIELHLSILREVECIPSQAVFEVCRDCSRFKRHVEKFRHYWISQPIQQIIDEHGDDMSTFLMTWLESLAAHATESHGLRHFSSALDRVFECRDYREVEMRDQDYCNILLALLRSYIHQTFLRRRRYPRRCSAERYAVALFTGYAENIERLARLRHPNLSEASILHSFAYASTRLDPIERAIFFYASLFPAFKMRWDTRAHRRLIEAYYAGFPQRSGAFLALAFITVKHATLFGLQHLYIGTCMLARMHDWEAWDLAWTEILHLISDE